MRVFIFFVLCIFIGGCVAPKTNFSVVGCSTANIIKPNISDSTMNSDKVTFIASDLKSNTCWIKNPTGINIRHTPWSTFKIPHSLIALETDAIDSINEQIIWDVSKYPAQDYWPASWRKNQTLKTAFKRSAHWYYQALVPRISNEAYRKWFARFDYGNKTMQDESNDFWLGAGLKISPAEQVSFLSCLVTSTCGLSAETFLEFEKIALLEKSDGFSLFAKTGAGPIMLSNTNRSYEGWFVGYIRDSNFEPVATFALFMEAENFSLLKNTRREYSLELLSQLKLWSQ